MRRRTRWSHVLTIRIAALALIAAVAAPSFAQEIERKPVASGGETATGLAPGQTFTPDLGGVIGIADDGTAVFRADVRDAGGSRVGSGVFTAKGAARTYVTATGDPVPDAAGTGSIGLITEIDDLIVAPDGTIVVRVLATSGVDAFDALLRITQTSVTLIGGTGPANVGTCMQRRIAEIGLLQLASNGTTTIFRGQDDEDDDTCPGSRRIGLYRQGASKTVTTLAKELLPFGDHVLGANLGRPTVDADGRGTFLTSFVDGPGGDLVVLVDQQGGTSIVAEEGEVAPGTGGETFGTFLLGAFPDAIVTKVGTSSYSMRFVGMTQAVGQDPETYVYQQAAGGSPTIVLRSGDVDADTLVALVGGSATRLHPGGGDRTIVASEVFGPDTVDNGGQSPPVGVWRVDPSQGAPELVCYTGQTLPEGGRLVALFSVLANTAGRVAVRGAVEDDGVIRGAWVLETSQGLRVAVREGDTISGQRIITLATPLSGGSGTEGRGTRFTPSGVLAFAASTDSGGALFTSNEKTGGGGGGGGAGPTVRVKVSKSGSIKVTGTDGPDELTVTSDSGGALTFTPGAGTLLNGASTALVVDGASGKLKFDLGAGADSLFVRADCDEDGAAKGPCPLELQSMTIKMGDDLDVASLTDVDIAGSLKFDAGAGADGDTFSCERVTVGAKLTAKCGKGGRMEATLTDCRLNGGASIKAGSGDGKHLLEFGMLFVTGKMAITGSSSGDDDCSGFGISGDAQWKFNFKTGIRDFLEFRDVAGPSRMTFTTGAADTMISVTGDLTLTDKVSVKGKGGSATYEILDNGAGAGTSAPKVAVNYDGARLDSLRYDTPKLGPVFLAAKLGRSGTAIKVTGTIRDPGTIRAIDDAALGLYVAFTDGHYENGAVSIKAKKGPSATIEADGLRTSRFTSVTTRLQTSFSLEDSELDSLTARFSKAHDDATIRNCVIAAGGAITFGAGDDSLLVESSQISPNVRVDGGPGNNEANLPDSVVDDLQGFVILE